MTGGGPKTWESLSSLEERLVKIMGLATIVGNTEVSELGFGNVSE